jgi:hypothetical protein|tara:strand:- start:2011 stop:2589 length:579 start_codon:yes stop_codon:yes gene_type:complete
MKKLSKYQLNKISKNLDKWFNLATKKEISEGLQWYKKANDICKDIAQKFNTSELIAASVISALSPRNKWEQNIKDAYKVFQAVQEGKDANDIKVCTFHTNKFKSFEIAKRNKVISADSQKTFAFVNNIAHLDNNFVTTDVWHLRACFNKTIKSCGKLAYNQIQKLTIKKADKLGLKGFEYQAIIWASIRNKF